MASRKPSPSTNSSPPPPPLDRNERRSRRGPSYHNQQNSPNNNPRQRRRSYAPQQSDKRNSGSPRITIVLCVYRGTSAGFVSSPVTFDRNRTTDQELWSDIRDAFRNELELPWRRLLLFKHLRTIRPIAFTRNDVPIKQGTDADPVPGEHEFMHAYRHPQRLRTQHDWVDWFVALRKDPDKTYGLEFVEGLWADKLALVAVLLTIAIIVVSAVWCALGGVLQTVFTVMGFVLTGFAFEIALIALYYQVSLPG